MKRQNISSGAIWEDIVGYSRAVRVGNHVYVAGTTATDAKGNIISEGDAYAQTAHILKKVAAVLDRAGANMSHVVRTRMFVTDISKWEDVGRAHGDVFQDIRPAATLVEVKGLVDPKMLVEIEVEAVIDE